MEKFLTVAQVVVPIFVAIILGYVARRKQILTPEDVKGLQQFSIKFCLPCMVFNSCLTADMGMESLSSMVLAFTVILMNTLWAFRARKKQFPYWNLPMIFAAQETGGLGIPLFVILFGAEEAYRMGVLDLTQAIIAYPVIAIITSDAGENPEPKEIVKKVFASPLLIMSLLGLILNLTGVGAWLESLGAREVIMKSTAFLGQPISAIMIFCVGYNFSLAKGNRDTIFKICGVHFAAFTVYFFLIQGILCLLPGVDNLTRWLFVLYCALPGSFLAPSMGRTEEDSTVASGVCSVLTLFCLVVFCFMAAAVA